MKRIVWLIVLMSISSAVHSMEEEAMFGGKELFGEKEMSSLFSTEQKVEHHIIEPKREKLSKQEQQKLAHEKHHRKKEKQSVDALLGGISPDNLAKLAPLSIAMYCFNKHPEITMIALTGLLLLIVCQNELTKRKLARFHSVVLYRWRCFKGQMLYMLARPRF